MPTYDERADALRQYGVPEEEIADLLAEEDEPEQQRRPRTVSQWKRHARDLEGKLSEQGAKLQQFERRQQFEEAKVQLPEDVRALVVFDDVKAEGQITPALLKVKALEKQEVITAQKREQAKQFGFEDPEQFEAVLKTVAEQVKSTQQVQTENRESVLQQSNLTMNQASPSEGSTVRQQSRQKAENPDSMQTIDELISLRSKNPAAFKLQ